MKFCRAAWTAAFCASLLSCSVPVGAQTFTGTIVGHVVDSQQAVVIGARVTLRSIERDFQRQTVANAQGDYAFEFVVPGKFVVQADSPGFSPAVVDVEVVVATAVRADLVLGIPRLQQRLRVVGENGVSVQTEDASLGKTISPREMSELPSLTRNPYDFMALMPGGALSKDAIGVGFAVNGGRTQSGSYILDGAENDEPFMSTVAQDVPLDSIEEFKIQTNHYSAEYGRNSAFTANIVTKSGTEDFHGSLYEYLRNSALSANTFDNKAHDIPRSVFNRNQFGGTFGGPIVRQKLFFFASTEAILVRSSVANSFFVPTPALLSISSPGTQAIFSRYPLPADISATNVREETLCPFGVSCNAQTGSGFVTLPAFAFTSRVGPQDAGAGLPQDTVLTTGRIDWVLNSMTQAFARYAFENKCEFAVVLQPYSNKLDFPQSARNQNIAFNLIRTWSPTLAMESRVVYSRILGDPDRFTGSSPNVVPFPTFVIQNEPAVLPSGSGVFDGPENFYELFHTVTWSRGRHTVRFGGQFVHMRDNRSFGVGQTGDATFSDTQGFVDGSLSFYSIAVDPKGHFPGEFVGPPFGPPSFTRHYRYDEPALFVADTWKATSRLTVTPGLRWEYFGVFHSPGSEHVLDANFYPGPGPTLAEQVASGKVVRTVDATGDLRGRFYLPDYKNFAPRLGIAYDLFGDGKTALRAGAGVFYDRRVGWELFRAFLNPPNYSLAQLQDVSLASALLTNQYAVFPDAPIQLGESVVQDPDPHMRTAYTTSWNATIEREIREALVLGISYLGSSGSRLYSVNNINRIGSGGLLDTSCITTRIASDGLTSLGPDYTNCPRLNRNLTNVAIRGNDGHSSYQALQLRLDSQAMPRMGLEFGANYTWSHSIDNASVSGLSTSAAESYTGFSQGFLDAFESRLDRGSSDFDVRHRIAAHYIWQIPFGKSAQGKAVQLIGSGWEVSGFLSYQTGQPFTLADFGVPDFTGGRTRPRLTGALPHTGPLIADSVSPNTYLYLPVNQVYDPLSGLCVADASPFGCEISVNGPFQNSLPRGIFRQPGLFYQDTALRKNFNLPRSEAAVQLRAEFYNVFNHPNLYINPASLDVSSNSFTGASRQFVPGVTAFFKDNRQVVLAIKLLF